MCVCEQYGYLLLSNVSFFYYVFHLVFLSLKGDLDEIAISDKAAIVTFL